MLIYTREIINIINTKREKINQYVSDGFCIITFFDENDNMLTKAVKHTGNSEYGDAVYWDEEVTEEDFQYFTIGHINCWLSADKAVIESDNKTIRLNL